MDDTKNISSFENILSKISSPLQVIPGSHYIKHFTLGTGQIDANKCALRWHYIVENNQNDYLYRHNAPLYINLSSIKCTIVYVTKPSAVLFHKSTEW